MTFQPNKKSFINKALFALVALLLLASVWLIVLYNRAVELQDGIVRLKTDIERIQTENSSVQGRILKLVDPSNLEKSAKGLVREKNPEYLEVAQWSYASQY